MYDPRVHTEVDTIIAYIRAEAGLSCYHTKTFLFFSYLFAHSTWIKFLPASLPSSFCCQGTNFQTEAAVLSASLLLSKVLGGQVFLSSFPLRNHGPLLSEDGEQWWKCGGVVRRSGGRGSGDITSFLLQLRLWLRAAPGGSDANTAPTFVCVNNRL